MDLIVDNKSDEFYSGLGSTFRLRGYDPKMKVMLDVYEPSLYTLHEQNIHSYFIFKVESEPYEEYNNENIHVRLVNWSGN